MRIVPRIAPPCRLGLPSLATLAAAFLTFTVAATATETATPNGGWPQWRGPRIDGTAGGGGVFERPFQLEIRWQRDLGSGYSGVVVAEGRAVTMFSDQRNDYVVALESSTGEEAWRVPVGTTFPGRDGAVDGPSSRRCSPGGRPESRSCL